MTEKKWIFLTGILVVLSFFVGIISVSSRYVRKSREWALRELDAEVYAGAGHLASHFAAIRSDLMRIERYLAYRDMEVCEGLISFLELSRSRDPKTVNEIMVLDTSGVVIASTQQGSVNKDFRDSEYFRDVQRSANAIYLSNAITVSDFDARVEDNQEALLDPLDMGWVLYTGVYSEAHFKGAIFFILRGETFYNQFSRAIGEPYSGHGFIIDSDSRVLFHRQVEFRGKLLSELPETAELATVDQLLGGAEAMIFGRDFLGEHMVATSTLELENRRWTVGVITTTPQLALETRQLIFALSSGLLVLVAIVLLLLMAMFRLDQATEMLVESEARFRTLFEGAPDAIFLADRDTGEILDANPAAEKLMLRTHDEIVGLYQWELHPPEADDNSKEAFRQHASQAGTANPVELYVLRSDGSKIPAEVLAETVHILGKPVLQSIFRDTTRRKEAEDEIRRSRAQLRELFQYLLTAREQERAHIAREIHDELGQALTALNMDLSWISKHLPAGEDAVQEKTASMRDLVDNTIRTIRRIATDLRPGMLDDLGLVAAIEWQANEFQGRTGVKCDLRLPERVSHLDRDQATALFRIFQEALTNVARHAEATRVWVELHDDADVTVLLVRDNGRGITEEQIHNPRSLGLLGMQERVQQWGGEVRIEGVARKGTTVTVQIPDNKQGDLEKE